MALPAPLRRAARRLERVLLGACMSLAALVIERRLLKAIGASGDTAPETAPSSGRLSVARGPAPDDGPPNA